MLIVMYLCVFNVCVCVQDPLEDQHFQAEGAFLGKIKNTQYNHLPVLHCQSATTYKPVAAW